MDLTQLEMFNAVAQTGSITQAAQKVHRVPSNLTTRIRQLEADLGVDLFIRENQRLRLSPAGTAFCATVSKFSRWSMKPEWLSLAMSLKGCLHSVRWKAPPPCAFRRRWRPITAATRGFSLIWPPAIRYHDRRRTGRYTERRFCRWSGDASWPRWHAGLSGRDDDCRRHGHPRLPAPVRSTAPAFTRFALTVPIVVILRAGFIAIRPRQGVFTKWSLITACWPA